MENNDVYPKAVFSLLEKIKDKNKDQVQEVAKLLASVVDKDGILYVFGTGHSSLFAEETFHRAGGLIPVYPILHAFLSPHTTPKIAGKIERLEGLASILFSRARVMPKDAIWIASNSGINAASIEMALEARKNSTPVIALTSMEHSVKIKSRHTSLKKLYELSDFVFDNCCPEGDALIEINDVRLCAGSTIANSFIYHWVLSQTCEILNRLGKALPIYRSANLPGGDEFNETMETRFRSRIPLL